MKNSLSISCPKYILVASGLSSFNLYIFLSMTFCYLVMKNDCPHESKNHGWISFIDPFFVDVGQFDLKKLNLNQRTELQL